jgi:putative ATPase
MPPQHFYEPVDRGFEARIKERLEYWAEQRRAMETNTSKSG